MAIKLDPSPSQTVVIVCDECPFWSAIRYGYDAAHGAAINHEKTFHNESENARRAARLWRARHAADSPNVPTPSASFMT